MNLIERRNIFDKLAQLGMKKSEICMGHFDWIGENTAKKERSPTSELYTTAGRYFRPNYERGILIDALIKYYRCESMLEIGFGRGYASLCAMAAFHKYGIKGAKLVTIDPQFDGDHVNRLAKTYPEEWFANTEVSLCQGKSDEIVPVLVQQGMKFDLVYIDGDHTQAAVQRDWEMTKDIFNKCLLFDDYHEDWRGAHAGIQVGAVVDAIDERKLGLTKQLVIMDRRIFVDDRRVPDAELNYGQVLFEKVAHHPV